MAAILDIEDVPKTPPPEDIDWSQISPKAIHKQNYLDGTQKNGNRATPLCIAPLGFGNLTGNYRDSINEHRRARARRVRLFQPKVEPVQEVKVQQGPTWNFKSYRELFEEHAPQKWTQETRDEAPTRGRYHPYFRPSMNSKSNHYSIEEILGQEERPLDMRTTHNFGDQR